MDENSLTTEEEVKMNLHKSIQIIDTLCLVHLYQPIYQLETGKLLGYEALVRNTSLNKLSPLDIFLQAEQQGCRTSLDCQLLCKAMASFKRHEGHVLFLNVFPSTLLEPWFLSCWDNHPNLISPLVLEISESEPINDWKALKVIINELRKRGVKIALDDMGAGYSFFQHWVELNPEYIKLDSYYANDLSKSSIKQRILENLIKLFGDSTETILEGIEKEEDLNTAKLLGIKYAQGYLLGRPSILGDHSIKDKF